MGLSFGAYLVAMLELAAIAAALGFGAVRARARLLPGWSGAPSRLAELVVALALGVWTMQALGSVGLLTEAALVVACGVVGIGVGLVATYGDRPATGHRPPSGPAPGRVATAIAALVVVALAAEWAGRTYPTVLYGMYSFDSLWYHMPFAARFAQQGSLTELHFTSPALLTWFYPATSELFHSAGILVAGRDILSPFINLAWLAAALLAAWCLGRPWGVAPAALVGAAGVLGAGVLADQAGEARNDIPALFFLLASAALLANGATQRGASRLAVGRAPLALAGLAAGLAVGTKLNLLAPAAALTVGVIVAAQAGRRLSAAATWIAAAVAGGGFWYARNLVQVGNPLPWASSLGPISLPGPEDYLAGTREPHALFRYLPDLDVWREWLAPGLDERLGALWPLLLAVAFAAALLALLRGRSATERVLGWTVLASAAAYPFTPLSASGPEGMPVGFASNLRYLAPVLALALALAPIVATRFGEPVRRAVFAALLITGAAAALGSDEVVRVVSGRAAAVGGLAAAIAIAIAWLAQTRRVPLRLVAIAAASAAGLAIGLGFHAQRTYLEGRYASAAGGNPEDTAFIWARDVGGARIATVIARQYPLYGADLSNRVEFVGRRGPERSFEPIRTCEEWRAALNSGEYDYVVTGFREPTEELGTRSGQPPQAEWTRNDPAAREVAREDDVAVFAIEGELRERCPPGSPEAGDD